MALIVLFLAALWAGVQNALAGGGSFVTLPALMFTGMDVRAANITSTIALFPAQIATAMTGRRLVTGAAGLSFRALVVISLAGGALGAILLLVTPPRFFAHLVPWLVLFATIVFAWGSFGPKRAARAQLSRHGAAAAQFAISIYGGYFGGGIGILMLAALSLLGLTDIHQMNGLKNFLALSINGVAIVTFGFAYRACGLECLRNLVVQFHAVGPDHERPVSWNLSQHLLSEEHH